MKKFFDKMYWTIFLRKSKERNLELGIRLARMKLHKLKQ